jgi:YVTN family beta-propeller protein
VKQPTTALAAILLLGALTSARGQYLEATIPVGDSPMWPMWSPLGNKVYVANTQDGTVSVIDGATNSVIAIIPVEDYPDMFALNTVNGKVYCPSGSEDRLNIICAYGDTLIRKVRLTGYPLWPAYNERRNKLYISRMDDDRVCALDGHADTVVAAVSIRYPLWLTLQPESDRLLVSSEWNSDTLVVLDCSTDTVSTRQPMVRHIWSAPRVGLEGRVYVPCESVVEVYSPDCREHLVSVRTPTCVPWASAYYSAMAKLYVGNVNAGGIAVVDCSSNAVTGVVAAEEQVWDLVCDDLRGRLYALGNSKVLVFDTQNDSLTATVLLPGSGSSLTWNPLNLRLYASAPVANAIFVVRDTTSGLVDSSADPRAPDERATMVRSGIVLPSGRQGQLLDASGRIVQELKTGFNRVAGAVTGVYFVRESGSAWTRRVVVVR